jgi:hypothetical protein
MFLLCEVDLYSSMIGAVIVCIAKHEQNYVKEFVRYHLGLGFDRIYLYDNEDNETYKELLKDFGDKVVTVHLPGKHYARLPQYEALQQFICNYMGNPDITHVAHIDLDEFIVLKQHDNIKSFIKDYIYDGENNIMCGGIGMNWRYFGNNSLTHADVNEPLTVRFTKRQETGGIQIKTIYNKQFLGWYNNPHIIHVNNPNYPIKSTNGTIVNDPFNENMDFTVIQLNHYKCKTWEEYKHVRSRGRADRYDNPMYDEGEQKLLEEFNSINLNETEDLVACNFYKKILES